MTAIHVPVSELPDSIRSALSRVGYHRKDIGVEVKETESLQYAGGAGRKGFALVVNIANGEIAEHWGSWGGANMFNPQNAVDLNDEAYRLPPNCAVIKGSIGDSTYAWITIPPTNAAPWLPAKDETLTDKDRAILYAYGALKSGPYRKDELSRIKATNGEIESLINRGYLKKDGRGIQITTAGKNARKS